MKNNNSKIVKCRLCNSKNVEFLFSKQTFLNYDDKKWDIYKCLDCGLKFILNNQHPDFNYEDFYNYRYKDRITDDDYIYQDKKYWDREVKILNHLMPKENISILDVGCNAGSFLYYAPKHWKKYGVEMSELAIIGRKHGLNILQKNIEDVNFTENFFDIITMYALIEHLINIEKVFDKIHSMLKPNGLLAIMTADSDSLKAKIKGEKWHMYSSPEHQFFFTAKSLDKFLDRYGFHLVYRYYTSGGMADYFKNKYLTKIINAAQSRIIDRSCISRFPLLDHMYSYYKLKK